MACSGCSRPARPGWTKAAPAFGQHLDADPLDASRRSSPWDVVWSTEKLQRVAIAMAGTHQIFGFDPLTGAPDHPGRQRAWRDCWTEPPRKPGSPSPRAWQRTPTATSGWPDSRRRPCACCASAAATAAVNANGDRESAVGKGLFDFGFRDGAAGEAMPAAPLGVTVLPDGSVAIADTYNGAVRRYDPAAGTVSTLARGLSEPSDVIVDAESGEPLLVVVEANKHQLVLRADPQGSASRWMRAQPRPSGPRAPVAPGKLELTVRFTAPTGQKLDDRWGDPTQLKISSTPARTAACRRRNLGGPARALTLSADVPEGVLHITARAAACDGPETADGEIPDHAACHLYQQDWGIPVLLQADGDTELVLDLRGMD